MAAGTPSCEFPYVLIPEDYHAFRDKKAAERDAKRRWASQDPAQRNAFYFAKVISIFEPDYCVGLEETSICPVCKKEGCPGCEEEKEPAAALPAKEA